MKKIYCPHCNMRLFDTTDDGKGKVEIKCTRCRRIVSVELSEANLLKELEFYIAQMEKVAV